MKRVAIVGAGVGGLSAALKLSQMGFIVDIYEARSSAGGLASSIEIDGLPFDVGPYIFLDREGLEWSYSQLGLCLEKEMNLIHLQKVYKMMDPKNPLKMFSSLQETFNNFDALLPGQGEKYLNFIEKTHNTYSRLKKLQHLPHPNFFTLLKNARIQDGFFLLKSLKQVFDQFEFQASLQEFLGIWTHIAGQPIERSPSPMAFVPSLIHKRGSFYPREGIGRYSQVLERECLKNNVNFHFNAPIEKIVNRGRRATGLHLKNGEKVEANIIVSNYNGIGTYNELLDDSSYAKKLKKLSLQSPGLCLYLKCRGPKPEFYLHFHKKEAMHVFVSDPRQNSSEWWPARVHIPMPHAKAQSMTAQQQQEMINQEIHNPWFHSLVDDFSVLHTRTPKSWGQDFNLYRDSMNPVMTAQFMRQGRIPHRSQVFKGLYLVGSSTHPGQWVSFCSISGILTAQLIGEDHAS